MTGTTAIIPAGKAERQRCILDVIDGGVIRTQEELADALINRGFQVTQGTISRDIHELRLTRIHDHDGARYASPEHAEPPGPANRMQAVLRDQVLSVEFVEHLGVIRTRASCAPQVGAVLDGARLEDIAGTVAGDDTVLVVARSLAGARRLAEMIRSMVAKAGYS